MVNLKNPNLQFKDNALLIKDKDGNHSKVFSHLGYEKTNIILDGKKITTEEFNNIKDLEAKKISISTKKTPNDSELEIIVDSK